MPLFRLTDDHVFPHPELALDEGLLAVGGDLSRDRLLLAYKRGIFPWYSEGEPILWWSPDPRMVLFLDELHVSRRLRRKMAQPGWQVTFDTAFDQVIDACAAIPRRGQDGTWITRTMRDAYADLHGAGYAHSVETWHGNDLVGGLYGVSLGACFFGESMFSLRADASKIALTRLVERLIQWDFEFIDCQLHTDHLARLGARDVPRHEFLAMLHKNLQRATHRGSWTEGALQ